MLEPKAIEILKECQRNDNTEEAHGIADDVLCHLLATHNFREVVREWQKVNKRYS